MSKEKITFEDEVSIIISNLVKETKKRKITENVWRGIIGNDTYKVKIKLADNKIDFISFERR